MLPPRCGYSGYLSSLVATDSTVVNIPVQSILHTFAKISGWSLGSQDIWILNINWASQEVLVVKNLASNAGDTRDAGSILGSGRAPGVGNFPLENSTDRGAWWATVHGAAKSRTQLSDKAI